MTGCICRVPKRAGRTISPALGGTGRKECCSDSGKLISRPRLASISSGQQKGLIRLARKPDGRRRRHAYRITEEGEALRCPVTAVVAADCYRLLRRATAGRTCDDDEALRCADPGGVPLQRGLPFPGQAAIR